LRPSNKQNSNFKAKEGEQNGARIYQLMLNSMQVLPVADISFIAFADNNIVDTTPSSSKGKRKAGSVDDDQPPKKKKAGSTPTKKSTRNTRRKDIASTSTSVGPMAMEVE
jgi:hypothetical protein